MSSRPLLTTALIVALALAASACRPMGSGMSMETAVKILEESPTANRFARAHCIKTNASRGERFVTNVSAAMRYRGSREAVVRELCRRLFDAFADGRISAAAVDEALRGRLAPEVARAVATP